MKIQILCIALSFGSVFPAYTQPSLYYRMDSLSLLSDHVVLCEEIDIQFTERQNTSPFPANAAVQCKVLQTFKGALKPDTEFRAEYDGSWARTLPGKQGYTVSDWDGRNIKTIQPEYAPVGRVLLFLKRATEKEFLSASVKIGSDRFGIVAVKLILGDQVLQFHALPYWPPLGAQFPESTSLPPGKTYGQTQLLDDLHIALAQAATMDKPVPMYRPVGY